eukprot:SAG11_NODE_9882_length_868_cov_3.188875_1_plen_80_part_00
MLAPKGAGLGWLAWARRPFLRNQMDQGAKALALADFADHHDIQTSRSYIVDSLQDRAGRSELIATAVTPNLEELFSAPW